MVWLSLSSAGTSHFGLSATYWGQRSGGRSFGSLRGSAVRWSDAMPADPAFVAERHADSRRASSVESVTRLVTEPESRKRVNKMGLSEVFDASIGGAARAPVMAELKGASGWLDAVGAWPRNNLAEDKAALDGLSLGIAGLGALKVNDALIGLADGVVALSGALDKMARGWPGAGENAGAGGLWDARCCWGKVCALADCPASSPKQPHEPDAAVARLSSGG